MDLTTDWEVGSDPALCFRSRRFDSHNIEYFWDIYEYECFLVCGYFCNIFVFTNFKYYVYKIVL